jgi:hypothetical protein
VEAAAGVGFAVDEGLDAEADAVDAGGGEGIDGFRRNLAGRALDGDLGFGIDGEIGTDCVEEAVDEVGREERRRAAAEVDGIDVARQVEMALGGPGRGGGEVVGEAVDVAFMLAGGVNAGGKVAVSTLRTAKRDGNVDSKRAVPHPFHIWIILSRARRPSRASQLPRNRHKKQAGAVDEVPGPLPRLR